MAIVTIVTQTDADFYRTFALQTVEGVPIDLTGTSMEMMLRRHITDEEPAMRLGTDTGEIVLIDPVNGLFTVEIKQLALARLGLGEFDQSNIMNNGRKWRVWTGTLTNNPGPSR